MDSQQNRFWNILN
jgi:hypothetical protein